MSPIFWDTVRIGAQSKPVLQVLEVRPKDQPEAEPLVRVLVQRDVRFKRDDQGQVYQASITLHYEEIAQDQPWGGQRGSGRFDGGFYARDNRVSLSSASGYQGAVFLDPGHWRGLRLGTYFMNEIVQWVKAWPDASVTPVELLARQADDDNRSRRNRFYEQFGLEFDYHDDEHRTGLSYDMLASGLNTVDTWQANIREISLQEWMGQCLERDERNGFKLDELARALQSRREEMEAIHRHPLRWAMKVLYHRSIPSLLEFGLVAVFLMAIWLGWTR